MRTNLKMMVAGLVMSNLLAGQIATTIVGTATAAVPLVYPNCTTPNFAVPAKPKDTRRFVHGDQVKESGGRKEMYVKDAASVVYDGVTTWALTAGSEILRMDMVTGKVLESHYVPDAVAFLLDGDTIWVGTNKAQLHRYSRSTRKIASTVTLGTGSIIKIATDGTNIVAVSNGLERYDSTRWYKGMMTVVLASGMPVTLGLSLSTSMSEPEPVSFTLEGGFAWIVLADGSIVQQSIVPNGMGPQKHVGDADSGRIVDAASDGASLWMVNEGTGNVSRFDYQSKTLVSKVAGAPGAKKLLLDGTSLWVATVDRVVQFHGTDSRKLGELQIGTKPTALLFDGMKIWVADRYSAMLKQVQ